MPIQTIHKHRSRACKTFRQRNLLECTHLEKEAKEAFESKQLKSGFITKMRSSPSRQMILFLFFSFSKIVVSDIVACFSNFSAAL